MNFENYTYQELFDIYYQNVLFDISSELSEYNNKNYYYLFDNINYKKLHSLYNLIKNNINIVDTVNTNIIQNIYDSDDDNDNNSDYEYNIS